MKHGRGRTLQPGNVFRDIYDAAKADVRARLEAKPRQDVKQLKTGGETRAKNENTLTSLASNNDGLHNESVARATIGAEKQSLATPDSRLLTGLTIDGATAVGADSSVSSASDEVLMPLATPSPQQRINTGSGCESCICSAPADNSQPPEAREKSLSVCDAQMGAVAQLLDIVNDLKRAQEAHTQMEREKRAGRLHNRLQESLSFEDLRITSSATPEHYSDV